MVAARKVGLAIVLAGWAACGSVSGAAEEPLWQSSEATRDAFLVQVRPILQESQVPLRVYVATDDCGRPGWDVVFPKLILRPPTDKANALAAVRSILRDDQRASVDQDAAGVIRVRIGDFPPSFFQTKIASVRFDSEERYNEPFAIGVIESTREMRAAKARLRILDSPIPYFGPVQEPMAGLPHLPAKLRNLTADQAVDIVAKTFDLVIIHQLCTRSRYYFTDAVWLPGIGIK